MPLQKQPKREPKSTVEIFTCHCKQNFSKRWQLQRHIKRQHQTFKCSMCESEFKEMYLLKRHMEMTHLEVKHTCHMCGKHYLYKGGLRKHIRSIHITEAQDPDNSLNLVSKQ